MDSSNESDDMSSGIGGLPPDWQDKTLLSYASIAEPSGEGIGLGLRDTIFEKLVSNDQDVVGLLAYSLAMQNRRDWLIAFHSATGRDPEPGEVAAFDIGEQIERRLATYRKLAENALSGNSHWGAASLPPLNEQRGAADTAFDHSMSSPPPVAFTQTTTTKPAKRSASFIMLMIILAICIGAVVALAYQHLTPAAQN